MAGGWGGDPLSPDIRVSCVVLVAPWVTAVDALSVDLQPLAHVQQAILKDGQDPAKLGWPNIHQHVAATTEMGW